MGSIIDDLTGKTAKKQTERYNQETYAQRIKQREINTQAQKQSEEATMANWYARKKNAKTLAAYDAKQKSMMNDYKVQSYASDVKYDRLMQEYAHDRGYQERLMAKIERDAVARTKAYDDAGNTYKDWDKQEKRRYQRAKTGSGQTTAEDSAITKDMYQGAMDLISGKRKWVSSEKDPERTKFKYGGYKGSMQNPGSAASASGGCSAPGSPCSGGKSSWEQNNPMPTFNKPASGPGSTEYERNIRETEAWRAAGSPRGAEQRRSILRGLGG